MSTRRVVVTGLGIISPVGNTIDAAWESILQARSGIRNIDSFDASSYSTRFAGTIQDFDPLQVGISTKDQKKMDLFIQYGVAAAVQAMTDAELSVDEAEAPMAGAIIGSGIGGVESIERNKEVIMTSGPRRVSPFFIPSAIINMITGHVAMRYNLKGPNLALATACTTGAHCIGMAAQMIQNGSADVMLAGGSEKASCPIGVGGFAAARALSTRNDDPTAASRPWDKDRDGFVLGDGAAVVVLESLEHAKARNATIYAEVAGFGMSGDAFHITQPSVEGPLLSMQNALRNGGMNPEDVDYINAHGTSTPIGDINETRAIQSCFGDMAPKIPVSSTKSMTGHLLGAAGAIEAIFSILAIRDSVIPPTINLDNQDDDCPLDYVPHEARQQKIRVAMSNSFGFGGTNGTLIFKAFDG